jgi:hypothetical protein
MKWAWHVARMEEKINAYRISVGKPESKKPLRRHRRRWEDNIIMDLTKTERGGMDRTDLAQDSGQWRPLVKTVMNLRGSIKCCEIFSGLATGGFSRRAQLHVLSYYIRHFTRCRSAD